MNFSRLLARMSLIAVMCVAAAQAHAAIQSGSVSVGSETVHYQIFTGKDPAFFQSFAAGATLTNFESVSGVTPFTATSFDNKPVGATNFLSPKASVNGIFYSGGGQTPGDPLKASGSPFNTVLVNLNNIPGAHSGTNVLAPSDFDGTDVKFSGGFFSFGVQTDSPGSLSNTLSRVGWWTNPSMSKDATTPNIHVVDSLGNKFDNFLVGAGINAPVAPGDFFAVAFDKPIIQEVEFVPGDHATIDDVVSARDNKVTFVPEPSSWLLVASGIGLLLMVRGRRRG